MLLSAEHSQPPSSFERLRSTFSYPHRASTDIPPAAQNFDEYDSNDEGQDEETSAYLSREIDKAEADGHDQGKPGTLLNRMIAHGNKKTEDQIARESAARAGGQETAGVQNA